MPIPHTPAFQSLLGSLRVLRPDSSPAWRQLTVVGKEEGFDGRDQPTSIPAAAIWYREDHDLPIEGLLKKVSEELSKAGHAASTELASTVLGVFACCHDSEVAPVEQFNRVFDFVVASNLHQVVMFPLLDSAAYEFRVGPFHVGPFVPARVATLVATSGSDYYKVRERTLRRMKLSVERTPHTTRVIFWHNLMTNGGPWKITSEEGLKIAYPLVEAYFERLSAIHFDDFFKTLNELQALPMALGSAWFDTKFAQYLVGPERLSVYLNIGGGDVGFTSATVAWTRVTLGGAHIGIPSTTEYLAERCDFFGFTDCEIHHISRTYFHFLAIAAQHRADGRLSECFLHYVIALDLLLGREEASTASVSTRGAVLAHAAVGRSYGVVLDELKRIYRARSKYVHEGRTPDAGLASLAETLSREVGFCLLRLQRDNANRVGEFSNRWLKEIDFLVAAIGAGRTLSDDDLRRVGAWTEGQASCEELSRKLNAQRFPVVPAAGVS